MTDEELAHLIDRRQRQILVHSIIYYNMDDNLISDALWTTWAKELAELQKKYPEIAKAQKYGAAFDGFDPATGFNLPLDDPDAVRVAERLIIWSKEDKRRGGKR